MTRFSPPDVSNAMTPDAQRVVSEASAQLDAWLSDVFAGLEAEFAKQRDTITEQLHRECTLFVDEERRQAERLQKQAEALSKVAVNLTSLDPEQNRVIEEVIAIRQMVNEETDARAARWTAFSNRLVALTQASVASLLDGVN